MPDALLAYEHRLHVDARHRYEMDLLLWVVLAQSGKSKEKRPPKPPAILRS